MGIQVVGDKKRRKAEQQTGLIIDRLVRLDNRTWEARVLEDGGHRHFEINKADWTLAEAFPRCWSTCQELPDVHRRRIL